MGQVRDSLCQEKLCVHTCRVGDSQDLVPNIPLIGWQRPAWVNTVLSLVRVNVRLGSVAWP